MNKLNQLGITVSKDNKAEIVFDSLFPSFMTVKYKKPSDYITKYWEAFQKHPEGNNNLNGKIFEYILATLFYRDWETDRKSTRLNSSHLKLSRMPSSA